MKRHPGKRRHPSQMLARPNEVERVTTTHAQDKQTREQSLHSD